MTTADFLKAAETGDTKALKLFVEHGIDLNAINAKGRTAIHLAAHQGHRDAVTFLLDSDSGSSISSLDPNGITPMMLSAREGHASMVRFLLKQGAHPEHKDTMHRSALILAIDGNHPACVEELAPYSRDQLDTALLYAAAQGKHHVINTLTSFGASVYTRHDGGMTPLMLAAENGHTTTVHVLLENGSNRFAITEHGWTAAQVAAAANHESIASLLSRDPDADELSINETNDDQTVLWNQASTPKPTVSTQAKKRSTPLPFITGKRISSRATGPDHLAKDLSMRDYRQQPLPLIVEQVTSSTAEVRMLYGQQKTVSVKQGETIPHTRFKIINIQRKLTHSKTTDGQTTDISVVEIEDTLTGNRRKLISQIPATANDPWAVLKDKVDHKNYAVRTGQSFTTANGDHYTVTDIRPSQVILTHSSSSQTITISRGQ